MDIEKNIIFYHPLNPLLEKLKSELEEDDSFTIFEMDSLAEFGQVIGIFEKSISYCSDLKSVTDITKQFKQFIATNDARLVLVNQRTIPPHMLGMHKNNGLNKVFKANIDVSELLEDIESFFIEKDDEDEIEGNQDNFVIGSNKKKVEEPTNLRVKSMAILEEKVENVRVKNMFLTQGLNVFEDLKMDKPKQNLNLKEFTPKLKKVNFKPFERPNQQRTNTFKEKDLGGMLSRKSSFDKFEGIQNEKERKKVRDEVGGYYKRKEVAKFVEAEKEKKDKKKFSDVDIEREKKELNKKEEGDYEKKRKKFVEVDIEREKKRGIDLEEAELKKRKIAIFEEVQREKEKKESENKDEEELKRKNKKFEEVDVERERKDSQQEDEEGLKKKKGSFEEVAPDLNKKRAKFDEVARELEKKESKNDDEEENKKKKTKFVEVEIEREGLKKKEVEKKERKRADNLDVVELERDGQFKKKNSDEIEEEKERKKIDKIEAQRERKKSNFEEDNNNTHWGGKINNDIPDEKKQVKREKQEREDDEKEDQEFVVLDYKKFKKKYRDDNLKDEEVSEVELKNKFAEKATQVSETYLFREEELPIKNMIDFLEFYLMFKHPKETIIKFLHMLIFKDFQGTLKVFTEDDKVIYPKDCEVNELELEIIKGEMPSFGDERFESEENYYFMPISLDNKILAKLLIQFNSKNIKNDLIPFFDTYSFMLRGVLL